MDYLSELIKNSISKIFQYEDELNTANQIQKRVPLQLEEAREEISRALQAAVALDNINEVLEEVQNAFPEFNLEELLQNDQ